MLVELDAVVAKGTPEEVDKFSKGHMARFFAEELRTSKYAN